MRDLATAQHEAAHVVVGLALGMRLLRAAVQIPPAKDWTAPGYCWFRHEPRRPIAEAITFAAGVAWERAVGCPDDADADAEACIQLVGARDAETCIRAARGLLTELAAAHTRVTRALVDRDLRLPEIQKLVRGERLR